MPSSALHCSAAFRLKRRRSLTPRGSRRCSRPGPTNTVRQPGPIIAVNAATFGYHRPDPAAYFAFLQAPPGGGILTKALGMRVCIYSVRQHGVTGFGCTP